MKFKAPSFAFSASLALFQLFTPVSASAQATWQFSDDGLGWFGHARAKASGSTVALRCSRAGAPAGQYPGDRSGVSLFDVPANHFTFLLPGSVFPGAAKAGQVVDVAIEIDGKAIGGTSRMMYLQPEKSFAALLPMASAVFDQISTGTTLSLKPQGAAKAIVVPLDGSSQAIAALGEYCQSRWTARPMPAGTAGDRTAGASGPLVVQVPPPPFRGLSPAQHSGRLLTGFPIIHGLDASSDLRIGSQVFSKPSFDLAYFLDLMIARSKPAVFERSEIALRFAQRYMAGAERDRYFAGCRGSCSPNLPYDGWAGSNEFERAGTYRAFMSQMVPKLQAAAPKAPVGLLNVIEVQLRAYDTARGGFPISTLRGGFGFYGTVQPASAARYEMQLAVPQMLEMPAGQAEALLSRLTDPKRRAYLAAFQTISEPGWDHNTERPSLTVTTQRLALFSGPQLSDRLYEFPLDAPPPASVAQPAAAVEEQLSIAMLLARFGPGLLPQATFENALRAQIQNDQYRLQNTTGNLGTPFFSKDEILGRAPQFVAKELAGAFPERVQKALSGIPSRVSVQSTVSLSNLVYEDGVLRRNVSNWPFKALDIPLTAKSGRPEKPEAAGDGYIFAMPRRVTARMPEGAVPTETLGPTLKILRASRQTGLLLDIHPVIPPLALSSRDAEALYIRPDCETNRMTLKQQGIPDKQARLMVEKCYKQISQYKPEIRISLDIEVLSEAESDTGQPALAGRVVGATAVGPKGEVLKSYTREELLAAVPRQEEQAPPVPTATIGVVPTAALVLIGARLMDQDPLSVMEGIVGWHGDRSLGAFEKRDLATALVAEGKAADAGEIWVGGSINWADYDFDLQGFPVRSVSLSVLSSLHETMPRGVKVTAVNEKVFALPMEPEKARAFMAEHGGSLQFPVRARITPVKAGISSGALYLQSEILNLEVFQAKTEPLYAAEDDLLLRLAQPVEQSAAEQPPAEERPVSAPSIPRSTDGPDIAGLRIGMTVTEAENVIRDKIDIGWTGTGDADGNETAHTPFSEFQSYISSDGTQQIVLFTGPGSADQVIAITRSIYIAKVTAPEAIEANLSQKYGPPLSGRESGQIVWTEKTGAKSNIQTTPANTFRMGNCFVSLAGSGFRTRHLDFGDTGSPQDAGSTVKSVAPTIAVYSGRQENQHTTEKYDTEIWRECAPVVLAEIRESDGGTILNYALISLPDYAAAYRYAIQAKDEAKADVSALPDL